MKIGILTYYAVHNHGALLQAFGLEKVLENMGNTVEFLTFNRNYDRMPMGNEKKYQLSISSIPFFMKYFADNGAGTFIYNFNKMRNLNKFRNNKLHIGERYSDKKLDAVCIGSDEVFSIDVGVNPFFYGHNLKCGNIFSYAGTFGQTTIEDIKDSGTEELISSGFAKMNKIGVRDENSKNIVERISDKEPILVCDPVILYGYKREINKLKEKKKPSEKYILLYSYDKNSNEKSEIEQICDFAKKNGLKVYSVGYFHRWCDKNIIVSPFELIYYFLNASFVITDTFHGSVLSIITNTEFAVLLRDNSNKLEFLLKQYGLENQIVKSYSELYVVSMKHISFDVLNDIIDLERKKATGFLESCLE